MMALLKLVSGDNAVKELYLTPESIKGIQKDNRGDWFVLTNDRDEYRISEESAEKLIKLVGVDEL